MSLLVDLSAGALDPAYARAAGRRAQDQPPRTPGGRPATWVLALLAAIGLVGAVAVGQVRRAAPGTDSARRSLAQDVRQQTRSTDQLEAQAAALRTQVSAQRDRALGADAAGRAAAARLTAVEVSAGAVAVRGPGVVVTLDDAPAPAGVAQPRGGRTVDGRIFDRDLGAAVNALWAAGAEAVSVNGQRVTSLTAIRAAGEAILVDLRPLSPPYVLRAIGDPDALEPAFAETAAARRFTTYTSLYGVGFDVRRAARLVLAPAATPDLRSARPGTS